MSTWRGGSPPAIPDYGWPGRLRLLARGAPLAILVFGGLGLLLLCRLIERPIFGLHRPVTPHITRAVCRGAVRLLGLTLHIAGKPLESSGAMVANHASWLDIFVLNACTPLYFVSKSEVADWPGIGWLARATGTVFIRRDPRDAHAQRRLFEDRLRTGHRLLFFPEGTSTDGQRVLTFKTTLFAAFFAQELRDGMAIQPVSVAYTAPDGEAAEFYGWWGDMGFGSHLAKVLSVPSNGSVRVTFHAPLPIANFANRKALAKATETAVRGDRPSE